MLQTKVQLQQCTSTTPFSLNNTKLSIASRIPSSIHIKLSNRSSEPAKGWALGCNWRFNRPTSSRVVQFVNTPCHKPAQHLQHEFTARHHHSTFWVVFQLTFSMNGAINSLSSSQIGRVVVLGRGFSFYWMKPSFFARADGGGTQEQPV